MSSQTLSFQQQRLRELSSAGDAARFRARAQVELRGPVDREELGRALAHAVADAPGLARTLVSTLADQPPARVQWTLQAPALEADEHALRQVLERAVAAYRGTPAADDPAPGLTYAQYVAWQAELQRDPETQAGRDYWSGVAAPDAARLRLPYARQPRPPRAFAPATLVRHVDAELARGLALQASAARVDLAALLLAAYQVLLWRELELPGLEIGVGLDGRAHAALRGVPGPCALYVPVALEPRAREPLAGLARRTAALLREHRQWQDCFSWDALARTTQDEGACFHAFGFDWRSWRGRRLGGRAPFGRPEFRLLQLHATQERFELRLVATRIARSLELEFEWNREQYDEQDVASFAGRYLHLLADCVSRPEAPVGDLELVGPAERAVLLARARGPQAPAPADQPAHAAFEDWAAREGQRTAVIAGDTRLTYEQLDRRARDLAARLHAAGVRPGQRVAIGLPRTADQFVAMLAVLKLGAAFVPLDPFVPWDRLAWTLADSGAVALVAPADIGARLPAEGGPTLVAPGPASDDLAAPLAAAPRVEPAAAAYVIYTSGSTGRPKGVVVSHRNLVHSTAARATYYGAGVGSFLLISPLAFDSAMAGVFWTLGSGGTLVLPGDGEHNDPQALRGLIERHGVTHLLCLPSLYAWLIETERPEALHTLRVAIVAGERCPATLAERQQRLLPAVELHNEYGPTECSVWSSAHPVRAGDASAGVPIGRPIARMQMHVVERPWRLAPGGVAGEALIGGAGVADGYLGRPDLTAERFVPDAWSGEPGARAYRSGDRVRWLPDGTLDFLGRVDHQVKLRGYRLELEEVEAALGAHPDVRECAVALHGAAGAETLAAYVVAGALEREAGLSLPEGLRRFLGERLPHYMVPGAVLVLEALPKTPNGKVDRARLPAPGAQAEGPVANPPETETEKVIAALWQEALGRREIDVQANFFDLGGHSLMAIAIFTRLGASRAPGLRLVDLFEHPTVRALAAFVDALPAGEATAAAPALEAGEAAADARARQQALRRKRLEVRAS
jgi:amino acid adenylation domain-containing protein